MKQRTLIKKKGQKKKEETHEVRFSETLLAV